MSKLVAPSLSLRSKPSSNSCLLESDAIRHVATVDTTAHNSSFNEISSKGR